MVPPPGDGPAADPGQPEPPESPPPPARRRRVLRAVLVSVLALALLVGVGGAVLYLKLDGNISHIDIEGALGEDRPDDTDNGSLDLLVLGSDTRDGENGVYGGDDPDGEARSDTAMIVHINEDHDAASVISIPRDTLVPRPECERLDGGTAPAADRAMFNEAYGIGGPVCAIKTVEGLTGLRMDHYLEVDFDGFARLVDTLGGVEVTTSEAIADGDSKLRLDAGTHTLSGRESLALVRTRKAVGDGSDLSRIQLQHSFLQALVEQVNGVDLLGNPKRLYDLADTATSALTTDSDLASVSKLVGLARTLRDIEPDALQLLTLPVGYDPEDPNRVAPLREQSEQVWRALREDRPVPESAIRDSAAEEGGGDELIIPG
ncbi:LCP family protein [Streptomyces sp. DSM 44915]|uniref:LCP family protein n=1 Tax=Streptomyces chisholmiae TaxID=3075540 RepID=A0ABU2JZ29_9ACTN|nr:LCP family protein [Streptomyces sp. DSM 44915]MDT0270013.1 LCP family protein [Streptomyces sp. DSM 44915]